MMKRYLHAILRRINRLIELRKVFQSRRGIFKKIYLQGGWGDDESVSGSGSSLKNTQEVIKIVTHVIENYAIRTILDIPCGDYNWMKEINLDGRQYWGVDIVEDLIKANTRNYGDDNHGFFTADLAIDDLPKADLLICRDCLVHLSEKDISKAVRNIKRSRARYLLTTTFPEHQNRNIITGSWRPLNLQSPPFCFGDPIAMFSEKFADHQYKDKSLGLWLVDKIPDFA